MSNNLNIAPELVARIVEAEAGVLDYKGKIAVAQCIVDNNYNTNLFTTPASYYSSESLKAAKEVLEQGKRRFYDAKILQFRSFKNYGKNGLPDWEKLKSGNYPIPDDMIYLGEDHVGEWGHFYFGRKMMKKFRLLLIAGHGKNTDGSYDPGACGNGYQEASLARELVKLIKAEADKKGISCDIAPDRNHFSYFKNGGTYDFSPYTYVLEVHFNSSAAKDFTGNGVMKGSMMYIDQREKGHSVEDAILSNLYAIGSKKTWDGVVISQRQYPSGLLVQNRVVAQGISHGLLETCFMSDKDDMLWYQAKKKQIAQAVISGIIKGFKLNVSTSTTASPAASSTPSTAEIYRVRKTWADSASQIGAYSSLTNAKNACKDGYSVYDSKGNWVYAKSYFMVKVTIKDLNIHTAASASSASKGYIDPGVYTIVKTEGEWGFLKSGVGYIHLDYVTRL